MPKTKLSYPDQSNFMRSVMKTRQDNDVIDHKGLGYAKNDIKLSRPIGLDAVCD